MKNKFTDSLKFEVEPINCTNLPESLLKDLGIFPLHENIEVELSENNKYLNLKLKSNNNIEHLLFQIPLEDDDLSALKNHPQYHELLNRYNTYTNEYMYEINNYALEERKFLQENFPGLVFNIKIRIKSYESYIRKLNANILEGKSPFINDIMAERIIVSEYNDSKDEETLSALCDKIAKALYDFRINTDFRMKQDNSEKNYLSKDYIKTPKPNGYKSIHILMENKNNKDFDYETQIRTFEMEHHSKTSEEVAHKNYKPRVLNELSTQRLPLYSVITQFNDNFGNPITLDASFDNRFYHFYGTSYETYKKELYKIESSLGISFKEIRENLKKIELPNRLSQNQKGNLASPGTPR